METGGSCLGGAKSLLGAKMGIGQQVVRNYTVCQLLGFLVWFCLVGFCLFVGFCCFEFSFGWLVGWEGKEVLALSRLIKPV